MKELEHIYDLIISNQAELAHMLIESQNIDLIDVLEYSMARLKERGPKDKVTFVLFPWKLVSHGTYSGVTNLSEYGGLTIRYYRDENWLRPRRRRYPFEIGLDKFEKIVKQWIQDQK